MIDSSMSNFTKLCETCTHKGCCTDFASPLVFENDLKNLKQINKHTIEFVKDIWINGKHIKTIRKNEGTNNCIFWDTDCKKCSIYKNRPFDCLLYPFDIHLINDSYHWVVYTCNPASDWSWTEEHLKALESDDRFHDVISNIAEFSDLNEISKLVGFAKETMFVVLREVHY
jgi:Fe-S-cluster containining protein